MAQTVYTCRAIAFAVVEIVADVEAVADVEDVADVGAVADVETVRVYDAVEQHIVERVKRLIQSPFRKTDVA